MDGVTTRRIVAAKDGSTSMSLATVASSRSKVVGLWALKILFGLLWMRIASK
jgi:hypothetical protein